MMHFEVEYLKVDGGDVPNKKWNKYDALKQCTLGVSCRSNSARLLKKKITFIVTVSQNTWKLRCAKVEGEK